MGIEGGLVYPLGVNVENYRIAQSFVKMNADAARLGARRLEERLQFVAELLLFPGDCFEPNKGMQRQDEPRAEYSLGTGYREQRSAEDANVRESRAPQFAGNRAVGSALRFLGDSADLTTPSRLNKMT